MTRCTGCQATWTGHKLVHCAKCHHTFTTYANFDTHLDIDYDREPPVKCRTPEDAGMARHPQNGHWHQPDPSQSLASLHRASTESDETPAIRTPVGVADPEPPQTHTQEL